MSEDNDQKKGAEDGIFRLDTVPPPAGAGDAYSAPTRVGEMPASVLDMMKKAAIEGTQLKPLTLPKKSSNPPADVEVELGQADIMPVSQKQPAAADESAPASAPASAPSATPAPAAARKSTPPAAAAVTTTANEANDADAKAADAMQAPGSAKVSAALILILVALFALAWLLNR